MLCNSLCTVGSYLYVQVQIFSYSKINSFFNLSHSLTHTLWCSPYSHKVFPNSSWPADSAHLLFFALLCPTGLAHYLVPQNWMPVYPVFCLSVLKVFCLPFSHGRSWRSNVCMEGDGTLKFKSGNGVAFISTWTLTMKISSYFRNQIEKATADRWRMQMKLFLPTALHIFIYV